MAARRTQVILIAAILIPLEMGVRPAYANSTEDFARHACEANAGVGDPAVVSESLVTIPATLATPQELTPRHGLQRGDFVRVTVGGPDIDFDTWWPSFAGVWGPNGNGSPSPSGPFSGYWPGYSDDPNENASQYAAYGDFTRSGIRFRVGADSGCQPYVDLGNGPNTVSVGINDTMFDDNGGGPWTFRLRVFRNPSVVHDGGFEQQTVPTISSPWRGEGPDFKGIDIARNLAFSGRNNAFIRTSSTNWNAVVQTVDVEPNTRYRLQGQVRTSANFFNRGFFGVRSGTSNVPLKEVTFGAFNLGGYQQLTTPDFDSGNNTTATVFVGYWGPGIDSWIQIDDLALFAVPVS